MNTAAVTLQENIEDRRVNKPSRRNTEGIRAPAGPRPSRPAILVERLGVAIFDYRHCENLGTVFVNFNHGKIQQ